MVKRATKEHVNASEPVYRELRADILVGALRGGTPLRQDEIANRHGISKIPVREALRRLEVEGLVEFRPRRGAVVKLVSDTDIIELLDIRIALECRALELAIPNMIESDFELLQEIQEEYSAETERERWSELNLRFHNSILEPCGNSQLLSMIYDIEQRMGALMRLRVTEASGRDRPLREHAEILEACIERDVPRAVSALKEHIEETKKEVAAFLRRKALRGVGKPS